MPPLISESSHDRTPHLARVWPAILCALVLLAAALLARPFAETGISDDWSYVRTAAILAKTGHIVYNGWAAVMLGAQLFPAALLMRLIGPSYAAARACNLLEALIAAFLLQRLFVRLGIHQRTAVFATVAFFLSPIALLMSVVFVTDMTGIAAIVAATYACIRALQARLPVRAVAWLSLAALISVAGGSARQIAWLPALVMLPAVAWLLRRDRRIVLAALALWAGSGLAIFGLLHWFKSQQYSVTETLTLHVSGPGALLTVLMKTLYTGFFEAALFLLPASLLFVLPLWGRSRKLFVGVIGCWLLLASLCGYQAVHGVGKGFPRVPPYMRAPGTLLGFEGIQPATAKGLREPIFTLHNGIALHSLILLGVVAIAGCVIAFRRRRPDTAIPSSPRLSWRETAWLFVPFALAYAALLVPRATDAFFYERYLLPLMIVSLAFLMKFYSENISGRLSAVAFLLLLPMTAFSVAWVHDSFAMYRASMAAIAELTGIGIPRTAIDGGWEYNFVTQLDAYPSINEPGVKGWKVIPTKLQTVPEGCSMWMSRYSVAVQPSYVLAWQPGACGSNTGLPAVPVGNWLGRHPQYLHISRLATTK